MKDYSTFILESLLKNKKVVYYTQSSINNKKVKELMKSIGDNWKTDKDFLELFPVAFERYEGKLYLTEGHHRFEACLKLNNLDILNKLFDEAIYYDITWKPTSFKKKVVEF